MTDIAAAPQAGRQHCPKCQATAAKAATLTLAFVYLRCEAWAISEGVNCRDARRQLGPDARST
jgi:hypothetical protein